MNGYAEPYPLSSLGLFACKYFYSALFLTLFSSTITIARTVESLRGYQSKAGPGKNFYSSWEISKFIFSFIHLHKNAYLSGQIYSFTLKSKKIPYPLTPHPLYSPDDSFIHKSSSSSTV